MTILHGKTLAEWRESLPVIKELMAMRPIWWANPGLKKTADALPEVGLTMEDVRDAAARLKRFAPYFMAAFPETRKYGGILESPLVAAPALQGWISERENLDLPGSLWLKLDSELPISGSIKARGGIHEVLEHAETLAMRAGKLRLDDDYATLDSDEFRKFFSRYSVAVGSTGNLGLSIGIMSATLGFRASVHMSADARQWKKDTLREHGVSVHEYDSDYSEAVAMGRKAAEGDADTHFVDDENSRSLFLGYAVAALRLAGQLAAFDIPVDAEHPLFVYLPCGVGGGPGGVCFGLKALFGDDVHCIFCEPTHSPSMLLGVCTGLHSEVAVQDFGIDNRTAADGLACGRPSGFVGKALQHLLDGFLTMEDEEMFRLAAKAAELENTFMEPSSTTGLTGLADVLRDSVYRERLRLTPERLKNAAHIAWITGGSMVPEREMQAYIARGKSLLDT